MGFWADWTEFWKQFKSNFHTTGAIMPSSRWLGQALASELDCCREPARILEVGPGTGAVTREILKKLLPNDQLTAVEINPKFVRFLRRRFQTDPLFTQHQHQTELVEAAVETLEGEAVFDYIISGLPLNNFTPGLVRIIFRTFTRLLKPGGTLTYYEYALLRQLKTPFVSHQERVRLLRVGRVVNRYIREYEIRRKRVLVNVPPAIVRHLRFKPTQPIAPMSFSSLR